MSLRNSIQKRNITEVLHFSTNRGLTGSLASGLLLSRPLLRDNQQLRHVLQYNALVRPEESVFFDKTEDWVRFVNLSISEINRRFLDVSRSWHNDDDVWWCILSFDAEIMTHEGVWFATTNNGYDRCQRGQGEEGFEELFGQRIDRKTTGFYGGLWSVPRLARPIQLTTCEQAEVLYPEKLSLEHLRTVYVEQEEHHDMVAGWLKDFEYNSVEVVVEKAKFVGKKN